MQFFFILFLIFLFIFFLHLSLVIYIITPFIILQPTRKNISYYKKKELPLSPTDINYNYLNVKFKSKDGLTLKAFFIPSKDPKATIIYHHGIGDTKISGLIFVKFLLDEGFNIFMYDARSHGESEGNFCTYGFYEKNDISAAIDKILELENYFIGNIGIIGISMGGAIALQALPLENRINCCISEASFIDLETIISDHQKRDIFIISSYLSKVIKQRAERLANFHINEVSPLDSIKKTLTPVLFIHGMNDLKVSPNYSKLLYENSNDQSEIFEVNNAGHNDLLEVGGTMYKQKILEFLYKNLL